MEQTNAPLSRIDRGFMTAGVLLLIIGGIAAAIGLMGGKDMMSTLAQSYMFAWVFWACMTMGCFGLSLLFHVTRGRWGKPVLRIFEAGGGPVALALTFLALIPIVTVFKDTLYGGWLHPAPTDQILLNKAAYLNYPFFLARLAIYAVLLIGWATALKNWTRLEEKTGDKKYSDKRNNWAAPGIVMFIIVLNFMMTDLVMSLDPHWYSTMYGVWFAVGSALGSMGLATAIVCTQSKKAPYAGLVDGQMTKDFGNLLLMLTMLWAYFGFSQFLIIWSGNLPEFISYYVNRSRGAFNAVGMAMIIGQFFIPFLLLLSPRVKRSVMFLAFVGGWIFVMRTADMYYTVMPFFRDSAMPHLADFGMLLAIGGLWLLQFGAQFKTAPPITEAHPYMKGALDHA